MARPTPSDLRFDAHPTLDYSDPTSIRRYAERLDEDRPGWWEADETLMIAPLADEALRRRDTN